MKNLNFLAVTGCGLLAVFLISFTAACSRQSGAADAPVMQADSGGLQSVGTVDKTENGTVDAGQTADDSGASVQGSVVRESVGQAQEATAKTGKDSEGAADGKQDTGQTMARAGEEAEDTGQVSGNDGGEAGDESLVSGNDSAEAGDAGQVSGNDNGESTDENQVSGNNSGASVSGNQVSGNSGPGSDGGENQISGNRIPARQLLRPCGGSVSGSSISENDISGNSLSGSTSGNSISANSISQNSTGGNKDSKKENSSGSESGKEESGGSSSDSTVSGSSTSGNTVSGSSTSGNSVSGSSASGNSVSDSDIIAHMGRNTAKLEDPFDRKHYTLAQRQEVRSSHKETLLANELDKQTISGNNIDFSDIKITCLGDSITQAVNLDNLDNYQELAYPHILQETLDARKVYNLGIGGSSIGRYWADAFVDRYQKIPEDSDIILVMGGTNDEFCASLVEFGNSAERKRRTFWGDLDELMDGLKTDYPNAEVIFMTPLPNSLQDYLKIQHPYLIPQDKFADVIKELADEHGMEVIDLYNSNILDGHDKDNVLHFMPDGVHPNAEGYEILGEHVAADLIRILQSRQKKGTDSQ
ncbi:GDSL-type esterase/lipase family protein [Eisenbergiella porci]|uniref:GDSL-type esterase/lipase family protein n=1 Tax=Eisenbergiella porci TaxID=2652274 RepID=UPI002A8268A6|nr:GDSL-type esterase/lipase family protein [Eisenbergiella porci]